MSNGAFLPTPFGTYCRYLRVVPFTLMVLESSALAVAAMRATTSVRRIFFIFLHIKGYCRANVCREYDIVAAKLRFFPLKAADICNIFFGLCFSIEVNKPKKSVCVTFAGLRR